VVSLSGTIYDDLEETQPLPGVQVLLMDIKGQPLRGMSPITTDEGGRFEFTDLPKNSHVLLLFKKGQGSMGMDVFLNQSQTLTINPKEVIVRMVMLEPLMEAFEYTTPYYELEYYSEYRRIAVEEVAKAVGAHINELPALSELLDGNKNYRDYLKTIMTEEVVSALSAAFDNMVYKNYHRSVKTASVEIEIDGDKDDWDDSHIIYKDGLNDTMYYPKTRGLANYCDIKELHAVKSGENLYFMITFAQGYDFTPVDAEIEVLFSKGSAENKRIKVRLDYPCREGEELEGSITYNYKEPESEEPIPGFSPDLIGYNTGSCLEFSLPVQILEEFKNERCDDCVMLRCRIETYGEYDDGETTAEEQDRLPPLFFSY
jgi:hypothetical protein